MASQSGVLPENILQPYPFLKLKKLLKSSAEKNGAGGVGMAGGKKNLLPCPEDLCGFPHGLRKNPRLSGKVTGLCRKHITTVSKRWVSGSSPIFLRFVTSRPSPGERSGRKMMHNSFGRIIAVSHAPKLKLQFAGFIYPMK